MTKLRTFSTLIALFAASLCAIGCVTPGPLRTTYPPQPDVFAKLEEGARKVGWQVEKDPAGGLLVHAPNDEMSIVTAPEIATSSVTRPSSVGVKCKSGDSDACKRLFDQISVAAGLGPASYQ